MTEPLTEFIERVLPYDGPHRRDTVCEASRGVSALVRYLNNATGPWNTRLTLERAPTGDMVLGGIGAAVCGLDQLLRQLADALDRLAVDPTIYDDRHDGTHAAATARDAAADLRIGQDRALDLAQIPTGAATLTSHLGHNEDAGGEVR